MPLERERERTIGELTRHFSRDHLSVEELERRVDAALAAESGAALQTLVRDLPALPGEDAVPDGPTVARDVTPADRALVLAILGGSSRRGDWVPPRRLHAVAVMGGAELDFRNARFGSPVVEVHAFALMGGIHVLVPPGVRVEAHGLGIMGGFDDRSSNADASPTAPLLRIRGFALMGGVHVEVRLPGESEREARRRLRRTRKGTRGSIGP